jgi:gliding motility-associated-like protein
MTMIKNIYSLFFLLPFALLGQVSSDRNVVCNSGIAEVPLGNKWLVSSTMGEVSFGQRDINTNQDVITISGFQQPESKVITVNPNNTVFSASGNIIQNVSCIGKNDGKYDINVKNVFGQLSISLFQSGSNDSTILLNKANYNNPTLIYTLSNLKKGQYKFSTLYEPSQVNLIDKYVIDSFLIQEANIACNILPTTGVTPNGDGINDEWIIDGIADYPINKVEIFNRWGQLVWNGENYNNTTVTFKGLNNDGQKVNDGTYFYIIKPSADAAIMKGWIEVLTP